MRRFFLPARVCGFSVAMLAILFTGTAEAQRLRPASRASHNQSVGFDVFLPLQNQAELDQLLAAQQTQGTPQYHRWLTTQEFRTRFGAKPEDIAKVSQALQAYGMTVTRTYSQAIHVEASAGSVEAAFGASLWMANTPNHRQKMITTDRLMLPTALKETGARIVSFSPMIRHRVHSKVMGEVPDNRYGLPGPYWVTDLKQAYQFPSGEFLTGKGRTIAIVMSSDFLDSDIAAYFAHEKLTPPHIVRRPVQGGATFDPTSGGSFEAELDLQQSGGMAPGAQLILYNLRDLGDDSIIAGYLDAVENNDADIVSSSFGGPEALYTAAYNDGIDYTGILQTYEALFKQGNALGITFVASSGDSGALANPPLSYFTLTPQKPPVVVGNYQPGVEWPASSPSVTGVGGTNPLLTTYNPPNLDSVYISEQAYGNPLLPEDPYGFGKLIAGGYWGSGGGISVVFPQPSYQKLVNTNAVMRTVPDISLFMGGCPSGITNKANCNPNDGSVEEFFNGKIVGVIGTSISAPDFAGLLALMEEHLGGRLGNVNYLIYAEAAQQNVGSWFPFFHQNIQGYNGFYNGGGSYNYVVGNGTPIGTNFILAPGIPPAGTPQTPSNP